MKATPQYDAIPRMEFDKQFPVLVQVTPPSTSVASTTRVDFVAVLDISASMTKEMLQNVKEAMSAVVNDLRPEDRFSMSFCSEVQHCTQVMTKMSCEGLKAAFSEVDTLVGKGKSSDIPGALQQAAEVYIKQVKMLKYIYTYLYYMDLIIPHPSLFPLFLDYQGEKIG